MRRIIWSKVFAGLIIGCIARLSYQIISLQIHHSRDQFEQCSPCEDPAKVRKEPCPFCGSKTVVAENKGRVVLDPYKPKGMYEITRWVYFDEENMYDIIDGAPVAKLVGGTCEETKAVTQVALEYINTNKMLGKTWQLESLQNGYMRTDVFRGTDYMLDLNVKSVERHDSESVRTAFRVRMVHPFESKMESLSILSQRETPDIGIHIICLVSGSIKTLDAFVKRYTDLRAVKDVLTFVLFERKGLFGDESITLEDHVLDIIGRYPNSGIDYITVAGDYSEMNGFQQAGKKVKGKIVLTLTTDMHYGPDLLKSCRLLPISDKRVYFPTAFSQYDPEIVENGMPTGKPKNINKMDINKFTGYWMQETFDFICAYRDDFMQNIDKLLLSTESDVADTKFNAGKSLYDSFLSNGFDVISSVEPDLIRLFRKTNCNIRFMSTEEYDGCFRYSAEKLGSKPAMSMVYLTEFAMRKL